MEWVKNDLKMVTHPILKNDAKSQAQSKGGLIVRETDYVADEYMAWSSAAVRRLVIRR